MPETLTDASGSSFLRVAPKTKWLRSQPWSPSWLPPRRERRRPQRGAAEAKPWGLYGGNWIERICEYLLHMYACMHVCMCVCMSLSLYIYVYIYICLSPCRYVCLYLDICFVLRGFMLGGDTRGSILHCCRILRRKQVGSVVA